MINKEKSSRDEERAWEKWHKPVELFFQKSQAKRPLGAPRRKIENDIKMYLRERGENTRISAEF